MSQFLQFSRRSWGAAKLCVVTAGMLLTVAVVSTSTAKAVDSNARMSSGTTVLTGTEQPRVRIGIILTPYREMKVRESDGRLVTHFIPDKPMNYTLRARVDDVNHFYIANYHVETQPLAYSASTQTYSVRIGVWQRFGDDGSIEEKIGHTDVAGILVRNVADHVYVLNGVSTTTFRNGHGQPLVALAAGYKASASPSVPSVQPALLSKDVPTDSTPKAK